MQVSFQNPTDTTEHDEVEADDAVQAAARHSSAAPHTFM
jgi:hypothetical protein